MQLPDWRLLRDDTHMALMNPWSGVSCKSLTIDCWILQAGFGYSQKQHPGFWRTLPHVCPTSPLLFIFMPFSRPFSFVSGDFPGSMISQRNWQTTQGNNLMATDWKFCHHAGEYRTVWPLLSRRHPTRGEIQWLLTVRKLSGPGLLTE